MLLTSIQKTKQLLLFCYVLQAALCVSFNLSALLGPTIASVVVVCSLLKSFASSSTSCSLQPTKDQSCKNRTIYSALPASLILAYSLLNTLFFPSLHVVGIETLRTPSRQYTMSLSLVVLQFLTYCLCLDVLNQSKGQLRNAASRMLVTLRSS